ncbi:hypothetical protein A6M21_08335 [Desulfotomaculum copahuensis]|uniref:Uncharacterized protein n=1 Tax=Desulfotomaculum copahuensis TaxID=1838280 RepID=A0A1B7LFL6_9FIRM|nr:hypothetical protein A6M21_08335 [Desulfotomaculum copahuensis]
MRKFGKKAGKEKKDPPEKRGAPGERFEGFPGWACNQRRGGSSGCRMHSKKIPPSGGIFFYGGNANR